MFLQSCSCVHDRSKALLASNAHHVEVIQITERLELSLLPKHELCQVSKEGISLGVKGMLIKVAGQPVETLHIFIEVSLLIHRSCLLILRCRRDSLIDCVMRHTQLLNGG